MIRRFAIAVSCMIFGSAAALPVDLPGNALLVTETITENSDAPFPLAPWPTFDPLTDRMSGTITRRVWRIEASSMTTLQIVEPIRQQLEAAGYEIKLDCVDETCGGFDFRFALDLIGEPQMHVDLGDFRYLGATKLDGGTQRAAGFVISRNQNAGFVHQTIIQPTRAAPVETQESAETPLTQNPQDLIGTLQATGRVVLDDLEFALGSSELGAGPFNTLLTLSDYLLSEPDASIVLVGHTDAVGALNTNVELSKSRALSVLNRLVTLYSVPPAQLRAEGVGYLLPLAPNDTEAGRQKNRRVEAVLINIE